MKNIYHIINLLITIIIMATPVTKAYYDAQVAKYWQAKVDAAMAKWNLTLEKTSTPVSTPVSTSTWSKPEDVTTVKTNTWFQSTIPANIWITYQVDNKWNKKIINIWNPTYWDEAIKAEQAAKEAAKKEAAAKAEAKARASYQKAVKKSWSSDNLLKAAQQKYWVNSPEYQKIKAAVDKYSPISIVKTTQSQATVNTPINTNIKTLDTNTYNQLINKYITPEWIIAAAKTQSWDAWAKKIKQAIDKYNNTKTETPTLRTNTDTVITDTTKIPSTNKKQAFVWLDIAKKIWLSDADTKFYNENWVYSQAAQAKIDTYKANRDKEAPTQKKSLKEKLADLKKWELWENDKKTLSDWRLSWKTDADLLKAAWDKYWVWTDKYNQIKTLLEKNPAKTWLEWVDSSLLGKSTEEINKTQIDTLAAERDDAIAKTAENFIKWSEVIAWNNETLQAFYKNMAEELKQNIEDNKKIKQAALERTKNSELNRIVWQIRATLARRWVNIWNIPAEQLIAMSWELWVEAMRKIDEATTAMEQSIADLTDKKTAEINKYLEQWLIKQWEADSSIEQMRQLKEKMISDIKTNFTANVFKIAWASVADADKNKAEALNTISKFVTQLWISWTAQWVMENYLNAWDSVEALQNMITDLSNPSSELYKAVASAEKAAQLAAEFKAKIELMKATKSTSSGWWWSSSSPKFSAVQISALDNIWRTTWVPELSNVKNIDQYLSVLNSVDTDKATAIRNQFDKIREWQTY